MMIGDIAVIPEIGDVIIGNNPKIVKNDLSMLCKKGQDIIVTSDIGSTGSNMTMIIVGSIIAVIAVAGVIIFMKKKKTSHKELETLTNIPAEDIQSEETKDNE